ncbi:BlaI/MecI/CopY family transcriptional regulator [bacterium]|nr:BlaI/MecI/CopY family transcriptional regulator [bacterium]
MDNRLTRYELELMDVLWKLGEGTVQDVCDNLERELAYTTVMTTLSLLERKKGVLKRDKVGRAFVYRPLVTREQVQQNVVEDLRGVLFGESVSSLVLNLLSADESMSRADINSIRAALREVEQKNNAKRNS